MILALWIQANIIQSCRRFYQPCVNSSVGQLSGGS